MLRVQAGVLYYCRVTSNESPTKARNFKGPSYRSLWWWTIALDARFSSSITCRAAVQSDKLKGNLTPPMPCR